MIRKLFYAPLLFLLMLATSSVAHAQIIWKVGHNRQEDTYIGMAVIKFAERVKELTNGELIIKIFPNAQL